MRYYKKAIKKYAAEKRRYYAEELRRDIENFTARINAMRATGACIGADCRYCPISIASKNGDADGIHCGNLEHETVKKIVNKRARRK